jgi:alpha-tubulin suppressor-like RCC1 family protein
MLSLAGPIPQAESISVAGMSAFAFQPDGAVLSWGVNGNGRLGLGPGLEFTVAPPRRLPQTGWTSISLADHALGLRDRSLFAWGRDDEGQIGNGSTGADVLTATPVAGRWISVAAGETFSVGVQEDGSLWSWGNRDGGQLGDGTGRALLPEALPIP